MIDLPPNIERFFPDQCRWMWTCGARRYSSRIETMAYSLTGFRFDAQCPDCGFCTVYDDSHDRAAKMNLQAGKAREIALDMLGNLDAPL